MLHRRQLSVVDVNLFEASEPPTKVKHAVSPLTLPFKAEISYVRANDTFQLEQRMQRIRKCNACATFAAALGRIFLGISTDTLLLLLLRR